MGNPIEAFESALAAERVIARIAAAKVFPVGAIVLVDGRDKARVTQAFPEGSTSLLAPHYVVDFVGGDKNVKVNMKRVGVKPARGVKIGNMHLDDQELIALGILTTIKPGYRADRLKAHGMEYTAQDPTLAGLIKKGLLKVQGKALIPNQVKARDEMSRHSRPSEARDWPASFGPPKTRQQRLEQKRREDQEAWDRSFGRQAASQLRLGPGQLEARNSEVLKGMKKFRSRPKGDLASAVESAAGLAKKTGKDMYVWNGRSFMHSVWNVAATETKALGEFENIGQFVYRVTPELDLYKHEVLGRPAPIGGPGE